jgi:hypothetical protein
MNVVVCFACLLLMVPIAGFAAFGFVIDTLVKSGLWEFIKLIFSPLFDPFGRGIWLILGFLSLVGVCGAGFFAESRPYGLGAIACGGLICTIYCLRVYPDAWAPGSLFLFLPGLAGIGLSIYSLVRPIR